MKIIIAFIFVSFVVFGQEIEKPYPNQFDNEIWLTKYRKLTSDSEKISEIKQKVYSDTLFYNYKKRIYLDHSKDPKKRICKALIFLYYEGVYYDLDLLENPQLSKIMNSIQVKNITSIRILEPPDDVINFGSKGECGVIIMTCNKKLNKKIKKVL